MRVQRKLVSRTEEFMDQQVGNAAFPPAVSSPKNRSGRKGAMALAAAFLTSGVSAALLLLWLFENNILKSLWPNGAELEPGIELALTVAGVLMFLAAAFLLIRKRRKIVERQLICRNLTSSDEPLQVVVRATADMAELATALNSARQAFEKVALLKAAIEEHGAFWPEELPQQEELMQKTICVCSSGDREFRILREDDHSCRTIILTSPTRRRLGNTA
jgi:hypothetical protein